MESGEELKRQKSKKYFHSSFKIATDRISFQYQNLNIAFQRIAFVSVAGILDNHAESKKSDKINKNKEADSKTNIFSSYLNTITVSLDYLFYNNNNQQIILAIKKKII